MWKNSFGQEPHPSNSGKGSAFGGAALALQKKVPSSDFCRLEGTQITLALNPA
jgi:hypothetical protein